MTEKDFKKIVNDQESVQNNKTILNTLKEEFINCINQYLLDGKKYKMNQHGFASLLKHKVILKTKNEIFYQDEKGVYWTYNQTPSAEDERDYFYENNEMTSIAQKRGLTPEE